MDVTSVYPDSPPCIKEEIDVTSKTATQYAIIEYSDQIYRPITSIENNRHIEFDIPGSTEWIDGQGIFIEVAGKIVRDNGEDLADGESCTLANNFLHTLFGSVNVWANNTKITPSNNTNHYRRYFDTLLFEPEEAKGTFLAPSLWADEATRKRFGASSTPFDMFGRLQCDLFEQSKFIPSHVGLRITLDRANDYCSIYDSKPAVTTTGSDGKPALNPRFKILSARLHVRKVKLADSFTSALEEMLLKGEANIDMPICRTEVISANIQSGQTKVCIEPLIKGPFPTLIIIGFVTNRAFTGDRILDSFSFGNHNVVSISITVNGVQVPKEPYTPNWTENKYGREYVEFFRQLGQDMSVPTAKITWEEYKTSKCFYAYNLAPDLCFTPASHFSPQKSGVIRLDVTFGTAPPEPLTALIYCKYQNKIQIDAERKVMIDY